MMPILMETNRTIVWKLLWFCILSYTVASVLVIPLRFSLDPINSQGSWLVDLILEQIGYIAIGFLAISIGLLMGARLGLGLPFIEGFLTSKPIWTRRKVVLGLGIISSLASIILVLLIGLVFMLIVFVFYENNLNVFTDLEPIYYPESWRWVLVSIHAGICEEILFRFGLMTLLVWVGNIFFRNHDDRPAIWVMWAAILLSGLSFGIAHLSGLLPVPDSVILQLRVVLQNSLIGILLGWLYWKFGLECAIVTHILIDIGFYVVFIPLMQSNLMILIAPALLVLALLVSWAWKVIEEDRVNSELGIEDSKAIPS
jgi:hypothetical protein